MDDPRRRWAAISPPAARDLHPSARVRHLLAADDLSRDRLYGHVKPRKRRGEFLVFLRYVRSLYPPEVRLGLVLDNYSPHLSTRDDPRVGQWAVANNVELAYVPTNASWLNRIEAQFTALRYFALDGTDHASHSEQASMIRRYIVWRNRNAHDRRLGQIVNRANVT
jgi:transposase